MTFLHLKNNIVPVYVTICIFLDAKCSQAQQQKFCTREKPNFSLNKKCSSTLNKHRQFV